MEPVRVNKAQDRVGTVINSLFTFTAFLFIIKQGGGKIKRKKIEGRGWRVL
jgi:hypothetical protein